VTVADEVTVGVWDAVATGVIEFVGVFVDALVTVEVLVGVFVIVAVLLGV
jgi:hypothetical protein